MRKRLLTYLIIFFSGMILTLVVIYYSEMSYEEDVLNGIADRVNVACIGKGLGDRIDTAMAITHGIINPMTQIFDKRPFHRMKDLFISPSFIVYYYGQGACGGYSSFMARLLYKMNIRTKFVQQIVNGKQGGHITLVVENGKQLLLIDPLFSWSLRDTMGKMSDIHTVAANWPYYQRHKPYQYRNSYNYQNGWVYTNWNKFGFLSRGIYKAGVLIWGKEKMDLFCLRFYLISATRDYLYACLALIAAFSLFLMLRYKKYLSVQSTVEHSAIETVKGKPLTSHSPIKRPLEYFQD
jgi:hypothetical protein